MRVLHTSDWHLGRSLYGRKRDREFSSFLNWLLVTIHEQDIDVLLIAGDVFDSSHPSNRAQELYYSFLGQVAGTGCQHVVVIAGNHDSPAFLEAPKHLLQAMQVHVVGTVSGDPEDEVLVLRKGSLPLAIVCAVPFLRDRDLRIVEAGESLEQKNAKLVDGVRAHYHRVGFAAEDAQASCRREGHHHVPIIGMGHLFTAGGQVLDGDGVRDLYVGSLVHVGSEIFPPVMDYVALGHLHVPQRVGGQERIRYSGSPIAMGFGEARQRKVVLVVEFVEQEMKITEVGVPCFQELARVAGAREDIIHGIQALREAGSGAWLEVEYTGDEWMDDLRGMVDELVADSQLEVCRVKNRTALRRALRSEHSRGDDDLTDLNPREVFLRCLDVYAVPEVERAELMLAYQEVLMELNENGPFVGDEHRGGEGKC